MEGFRKKAFNLALFTFTLLLISQIPVNNVVFAVGSVPEYNADSIPLPEGSEFIIPTRMNDRGDIVAWSAGPAQPGGSNPLLISLYSRKKWSNYAIPPGFRVYESENALELNSKGMVAGVLQIDSPGAPTNYFLAPYVLESGNFKMIDLPPGAVVEGISRINKKGEFLLLLNNHIDSFPGCFLFSGGKFVKVEIPAEAIAPHCSGINDSGVLVGDALFEGVWGSFIFDSKRKQFTKGPKEIEQPIMISKKGLVLSYGPSAANASYLLYDTKKKKVLQFPGADGTIEKTIRSISAKGAAVGDSYSDFGYEAELHLPGQPSQRLKDLIASDSSLHDFEYLYGIDIDSKGKKLLIGASHLGYSGVGAEQLYVLKKLKSKR